MQDLKKELEEYKNILLNLPIGKEGRDYLKLRKITKNTAIEWELGYCPVGYIPDIYKEISKNPQIYRFWEKMWGRLIIPIYNSNNELISLSGRKVIEIPTKVKNPRYDHYPFNARKILFGLNKNKEEIFKENKGIITEGQLDVITAWQAGIKIVTSSFGAHCGENHFIVLNRYTDNIIVIYDNDDAGIKGTNNAKEIARKHKFNIKFKCPFPKGIDMDNWLQKHTSEEFFNLINYTKVDYLKNKINKIKN
jgi:DNA primase